MVDVLAELHAVDPAAVGLGDFGRPDGFLERQVRRWSKQLDALAQPRRCPDADELHARLAARRARARRRRRRDRARRLPPRQRARPATDDRIEAVLDWEMSTLGDPLTDVALLLVYDRLAGDRRRRAGRRRQHRARATRRRRSSSSGTPRRSGRDLGDLDFHLGLADFKLAVILEGIHYRYLQGQTVGEGFDPVGDARRPAGRRRARRHSSARD